MRTFLTAKTALTITTAALLLTACGDVNQDAAKVAVDKASEAVVVQHAILPNVDTAKLTSVLASQSEKAKARFNARNPADTLTFFGITPGMAVGEALPGGGWYTKVLVPYLGEDGALVGIDYALNMWQEFSFANEEFIENKKNWPAEFVTKSVEWAPADGPKITGTTFGDVPADLAGQLDAVLFVRALHNLARFEGEGQYMSHALKTTNDLLKVGGLVGVVQHRAPADSDDAWANGSAGYLKQANVIAAFDAAGFDFVKSSEINANAKDQPTADDIVWRLPPSLNGVGDDEALKAERLEIGESDRMTLLFQKR